MLHKAYPGIAQHDCRSQNIIVQAGGGSGAFYRIKTRICELTMLTRTNCQTEEVELPCGETPSSECKIPDYLAKTYGWAYLSPRTMPWLDRNIVVSVILFFNARRLMRMAVEEFSPGQRVLQSACVYGDFSQQLLEKLGPEGRLDVVDVAPIQIENLRRKLPNVKNLHMHRGDASLPETYTMLKLPFDAVCCFFLLHEVPAKERASVVHNLLAAVKPGGKIVFADYHQYAPWHPLRPLMAFVFRYLEPYAGSLCASDISALSPLGNNFTWHKRTLFGGQYQVLVGQHQG